MNTLRAEEPLLSYYQLDHDPFAARVPNFKFFPAQRKTILGQLHHLARHSQLMLLVTGPRGSGKTLLRQALIASINKESVKVLSIAATDCPKVNDALQLLAKELIVEEVTLLAIIDKLKQLAEKGLNLYLMIDDADQLSEDVLQLLLNLSNEQLTALHIFLFARPTLLESLEHSIIGKEVTFNLPLTPYTLEETKEYLTLRLEGAGQDISILTDEQIMDIYTHSGGWPGVINQVARDCLIENMQTQQLSAEPDFDDDYIARKPAKVSIMPKLPLSNKHLMIIGVIAVCLVVFLLFSNKTPNTEPATTVTSIANEVLPASTSNDQTSQDIPLSTVTNSNEPVTTETMPITHSESTVTANEPINTSNTAVETTPVVTQPTPQQVTKTPEVVATTTPSNTTQASKKTSATPSTKPSKPATTAQPSMNSKSANAWYRSQQGTHFTIQVSVASNEKSAKEVLTKQGSNYHYFKRTRAGKVDYVVTYGSYAKRTDAQAAIKKLPTAIQQSKPWVRTFASIKQELAK